MAYGANVSLQVYSCYICYEYIAYKLAKDTSMGDGVSMGQLNGEECNVPFDWCDQLTIHLQILKR